MDSNSFEPPPASKGNVARAIFYMATRYDGVDKTSALSFSDTPAHTNTMGKLSTLLLWHALDPPDAAESNRNNLIYSNFQSNRNPFIDRPEWVEAIWGSDSDGDGVTDTHELIAGTATNNPDSVFEATLAGTTQIVCGLLSSGSVWRLYQGVLTATTSSGSRSPKPTACSPAPSASPSPPPAPPPSTTSAPPAPDPPARPSQSGWKNDKESL
jgi:hypothetical protein